jgi:hypothetical protein
MLRAPYCLLPALFDCRQNLWNHLAFRFCAQIALAINLAGAVSRPLSRLVSSPHVTGFKLVRSAACQHLGFARSTLE